MADTTETQLNHTGAKEGGHDDEWSEWDPMKEDFHSTQNTLAIDPAKQPLAAIDGKVRPISSKLGHVTICERYAKFGSCADGKYCERIHIEPNMRERIWALQNNYEINKNRICMNYTYLSPLEIEPNPKSMLLVSVTNAISPANFYFVAPYETMNFSQVTKGELDFYIERVQQASSLKTKLQKCHEQMAALFEHSYRIDNLNDEIYPSQIVACKLKDGRYRRAMVIELDDPINDKFNYKLFLLDVGTEIELPRELIYDIKAHCLSEPPMAINGRLALRPPNGELNWSQEALELFTILTRGERYVMCKIIDYITPDRMFTVDLYDLDDRESLTDYMIERGLAEKSSF